MNVLATGSVRMRERTCVGRETVISGCRPEPKLRNYAMAGRGLRFPTRPFAQPDRSDSSMRMRAGESLSE
jgi:hypothetical protein